MSGIDRIQHANDITITVDGKELEDVEVTEMSFEHDLTDAVTFQLSGYATDRVEHGTTTHESDSLGVSVTYDDPVDHFDDDFPVEHFVAEEDDDTVEFNGLS